MTPTNRDPRESRHHYSDADLHNQDVAHEEGDINIRAVLSFAVGMAIVVALAAGLMGILFRVFSNQAAARDPQVSPLALPSGQRPPEPNLLTNEPAGLRKFHEEETRALDGYGWVDQQGGVARVPIEQAKKLLVGRGLPIRPGGPVEDPRTGTHASAYGEASSGRTIPIPKAPSSGQPQAAPAPPTEVKKQP
jgi:hypothetical protein